MTKSNELSAPNVFEPLQQVASTSAGTVSRPTWNPSAGEDRRKQIEAERKKEWDAYQERLKMEDPNQIRLLKLEAAVADLQQQLKGLKDGNN